MKFGTLIVDPPWEYVERGVLEHTGGRPYPMLTNDDLAALPIADWVTEDASMFLWTTGVFLPNAFQLIDALGLAVQDRPLLGEDTERHDEGFLWRWVPFPRLRRADHFCTATQGEKYPDELHRAPRTYARSLAEAGLPVRDR